MSYRHHTGLSVFQKSTGHSERLPCTSGPDGCSSSAGSQHGPGSAGGLLSLCGTDSQRGGHGTLLRCDPAEVTCKNSAVFQVKPTLLFPGMVGLIHLFTDRFKRDTRCYGEDRPCSDDVLLVPRSGRSSSTPPQIHPSSDPSLLHPHLSSPPLPLHLHPSAE